MTAVVLLSQAADELARSADHWLVLDAGTVTAAGSPGAVAVSPAPAATGRRRGGARRGARRRPGPPVPAGAVAGDVPLLESATWLQLSRGTRRARTGAPLPGRAGLASPCARARSWPITGSERRRQIDPAAPPQRPAAATAGDVRVRGSSIAGFPAGTRGRGVGLLFQHPRDQLFERTVAAGSRASDSGSCAGRERAGARAAEALAAVGLSARPRAPGGTARLAAAAARPGHGAGPASPPCWRWTSPPSGWTGTACGADRPSPGPRGAGRRRRHGHP